MSSATVHSDKDQEARAVSSVEPQKSNPYRVDVESASAARYKRIAIIAVAALVCGLLVVGAVQLLGRKSNSKPEPADVQTAAVERKDFEYRVEASGPVGPIAVANVASEIDGVVEEIKVKEGQTVSEGDVLIVIKNDALENSVSEAKRLVETTQLTYDTAKSNAEKAASALEEARKSYKEAYETYKEELEAYETAVENANLDQPVAPTPIDESTATPEDREAYQELYDQYVRALVNYNAAVSAASSAVRPQEPYLDETALKSSIEVTQTSLTAAELDLNNAKKALEEAEKTAEKRTIKAPARGTVVDIATKVGTRVGAVVTTDNGDGPKASDALVQIGDLSKLVAQADVTENQLKLVKRGQTAKLVFSALDNLEVEAEVTDVASKASGKNGNGEATFKVALTIDKPDARIKQGMTAQAGILVETLKSVLVVPTSAVTVKKGNAATVQVVTDKTTLESEVREVTIGRSNADETVIEEGLAEGDEVVVPEAIEAETK